MQEEHSKGKPEDSRAQKKYTPQNCPHLRREEANKWKLMKSLGNMVCATSCNDLEQNQKYCINIYIYAYVTRLKNDACEQCKAAAYSKTR